MNKSRLLEDVAFLAAVGCGVYAVIRESHASCAEHGVPWALVIVITTLALPKVLGRATAGAVWAAISSRISGK